MSTGYAFLRRVLGAAAIALASGSANSGELEGRVVGIQDGDTLTILDVGKQQHRVRLAGIDAPEKAQAFGESAKEHLSRLAFGRQVDVRCNKRDRYGRDVCSVHVGTRDVGLEQVRSGHAWWYRDYAREQTPADRQVYAAAEQEARSARRGLWRDAAPTAPWDWRRKGRAERADARGARG